MSPVVTRFPPSPTGRLHLGGARTALFNWLHARRNNGRFILRLEDTDRERSREEYAEEILEALTWLGLDWDGGDPVRQSERTELYLAYVQKLLDRGQAYYCTCTQEEIEEKRQKALASGGKPKYDGTCREKNLPPGNNACVRLKAPLTGATRFTDAVKGVISVNNEELDDLVIVRSDGTPTYHLAVVADDIEMGVTVIIRGDDHVSNTPRQILIYEALGETPPLYAHVPMVLGPDKKRLSKRHGAESVLAYRDMGYLPETMLNFLARLGWSHGDQEFFTKKDLLETFSIEHLGRSAGVFDMERLKDLNGDHIRASETDSLVPLFREQVGKLGFEAPDDARTRLVIETLKPRAKTLVEMAEKALFYYWDEVEFDEKARKKFLKPDNAPVLAAVLTALKDVDVDDEAAQEAAFGRVLEETELKFGKIAQPVRVALTGTTVSPGMFETIRALGKEKTLERLQNAIQMAQAGGGE